MTTMQCLPFPSYCFKCTGFGLCCLTVMILVITPDDSCHLPMSVRLSVCNYDLSKRDGEMDES
ncbi:hypothetical protein EX30DRAFT_211335 [Ascodesmis nigricans]|uniref:Uncharacterized protein n=1 Tax=Ascodesmis nigricans TaxID=341454 RepID=A0A4S2MJH0_9PEZI|nr:hypothetical protein EX30DRAFT_211335 [Ascodesmis nigricans]